MKDFCELFSDSHCLVEFSLISVVEPIVPGRPTNLHYCRTWAISIALAVGAGGVVWTFFLSSISSLFFLPLSGKRPDVD